MLLKRHKYLEWSVKENFGNSKCLVWQNMQHKKIRNLGGFLCVSNRLSRYQYYNKKKSKFFFILQLLPPPGLLKYLFLKVLYNVASL